MTCITKRRKVQRNIPSTADLLSWKVGAIGYGETGESGREMITSAITGFFLLLRIPELEAHMRPDVEFGRDEEVRRRPSAFARLKPIR